MSRQSASPDRVAQGDKDQPGEKPPVRVLIADDHEVVRHGMRALIQNEPGWTVCDEAMNGREAVAKAIDTAPDLLIVDLMLPELNGLEVIRQVRRVSPLPILVVTMHNSEQLMQEAVTAGANGYVLKSDAGRTLVSAVRAILSVGTYFPHLSGAVDAPQRTDTRRRAGWLTPRECEVLQLLAEGRGNRDVGATLGISPKTVETHRVRIMAKLELHSISELVRYAVRNHIIEP